MYLEPIFLGDAMGIFLKTCSAPRGAEHPPPRAGPRAREARGGVVPCDAMQCRAVPRCASSSGAAARERAAAARRDVC